MISKLRSETASGSRSDQGAEGVADVVLMPEVPVLLLVDSSCQWAFYCCY